MNREQENKPTDYTTQLEKDKLSDDLFWYILDHDNLHKKHFMPLAKKIKKAQKENSFDHGKYIKEWLPLVDEACLEYYKKIKMEGHPKDIFTKEFRRNMCCRLADQHHKDIEKDEYVLESVISEIGAAQMSGPSGPQYDTTGNNRLEEKSKKKVKKQRLDPKCWKGYRKQGTKVKGGVRVNNCVKVSESWENLIHKYVKLLEEKYKK